ncbi:MAG: phospholipid/cholesterol/gamma-HCH transport system substrate-binding protein, partial [Solirubrobacteraceae bacterium]|nr:phospholipid/cholesterol/gamma-HCH transport system substrate-binding protein [Solirubrobacteraceae bacterium]
MNGLRVSAAALFGFLAFCAVAFAMMFRFAGGDINPLDTSYRIQAVVPTAVSLAVHADVRQAGVKIGEVTQIAERGSNAVLMLKLDADHAPAYRNARVLVRAKTLSGENYVDLDPGSPAAGAIPSGGSLPISQAPESTQLDQIFATLDTRRRHDLQRILDALGAGLDGNGRALNGFLDGAARTTSASRSIVATLARDRQ